MSENEKAGLDENADQQIVKYIFDLSKEMNIEDTCGVVGNELELITLVRNCRFLYDKSLTDFKDIRKKNVAWGAIASVMHSKVRDVQQRWRSLREGYNKYRKELEYLGDANNGSHRPWEFYEDMKFIEPYILHRRTSNGNCYEERETMKEDGKGTLLFIQHYHTAIAASTSHNASCGERNSDIMQLIACIKMHPVLYDNKHSNYKVREYKVQAWNEVAQAMGATVQECELKWRNLRERYGRERKLKDIQADKKHWEYFEALSFLDTIIKPRRHSIFRPILPKPSADDNAGNLAILKPLSAAPPTFVLKHLIKDISKSTEDVEDQRDSTEVQIDPADIQHVVEFVDASDAMLSHSPNHSPVPSDSKPNLKANYSSPLSEYSHVSHDEDELFGQTVTAELRRMPSGKKKMKIKAEIYKILYENESDS